jgi:hypothetical protein
MRALGTRHSCTFCNVGIDQRLNFRQLQEHGMSQKSSHYKSPPKRVPSANPIVMGALRAAWFFWTIAAAIGVMIVCATYWLLTHPPAA